jgi:hypothetical protein
MSSYLSVLTAIWAAETAVLVGLLIYRALLGMREDDRLFLGAGDEREATQQHQLQAKIVHLNKYAIVLGIVSGVLLMAAASLWVYGEVHRAPF